MNCSLSAHDGSASPLLPRLGEDQVHAVGHLQADPQLASFLLLQPEAALTSGVVCKLVGSLHAVLINTGLGARTAHYQQPGYD